MEFFEKTPATADEEPEHLAYAELASLATRIHALLVKQKNRTGADHADADKAVIACLDDLLGAIYSLVFAVRHRYRQRPMADLDGTNYVEETLLVRANEISHGRIRTDGAWTAGFFLNNALFRADALSHRLQLVLLPTRKARARKKKAGAEPWFTNELVKVNQDVRALKHKPKGVFPLRVCGLAEALAALRELVNRIEEYLSRA